MTQESLDNRVRRTLERKRDGGIFDTRTKGNTNQLPVSLEALDTLVLTPDDRKLLKTFAHRIEFISAIAATLGMFPIEVEEERDTAWDIPNRRPPTPLGESRIEVHYVDPTPIKGHVPRATYGGRRPNSDGEYGEEQTYKLPDA